MINGRLKEFKVLSTKFRHDLSKHKICFDAVIVLVQTLLEMGHLPWQVKY